MTKILLIDDEAPIRSLLRLAFEARGFEVAEAENGIPALELVETVEPAAAVVDLIMPGMEGIETIRRLRAIKPDLRIVALSGGGNFGFADFLKYAKQLGADEALAKPVVLTDLVACVSKLISEAPA